MVNASFINRLSQAVDQIEKRLKQNRPWKVVKVRRRYDEDPDAAQDRRGSTTRCVAAGPARLRMRRWPS